MLADFIREHALLTLIIVLVLILAANVGVLMQNRDPKKNAGGWFNIQKTSDLLKDPWKEETEQLAELAQKVAALQDQQENDQDKP